MEKPANNSPCFFTQQVFLIGTYNEDGKENFAPISWVSYTWGEPGCLIISMHGNKQTKRNFERTKQLSATVVTPDLLRFMETCGSKLHKRRFYDKERVLITKGRVLDVPLIANSKWSYECELYHSVQVGETTTYFAEIKNINVDDETLKLDFVDLRVINPIVYSPGNYFTIGEHLGKMGDFCESLDDDELKIILDKFADSGWVLIASPSSKYLRGDATKEELIAAVEQAAKECGSCGCEYDSLYKRFFELKDLL
ncbi:MAG: flavin reductase family protein [Caldicoprobacteraceae bacterium]|jgi:flavin reductase (DIM6/NTAB) family NADH-FMN oxidoreductase RutF